MKKLRKLKSAGLTLLILFSLSIRAQDLLPAKWKFHTGDEAAWIQPEFDDSSWESLSPSIFWEQQGLASYDGYAVYRATFSMPESYLRIARKQGGFILNLGKVDDVDYTYFNGTLLGHTGELPPACLTRHDAVRIYAIPAKLIKWGKENTIAVRVFDLSGNGGIYSGPPMLAVKGLYENIRVQAEFGTPDRILGKEDPKNVPIKISNGTRENLSASLKLTVSDEFGRELRTQNQKIILPQKGETSLELSLGTLKPGFYKAVIRIESALFSNNVTFNFGYDPLNFIAPPDRQSDFTTFWDNAKKELASVDPRYKMTRVDSLCSEKKDLYLVEMHSLGNALVRGWLSLPKAEGSYPVIMQVPGYSSVMKPEYIYYADDIIGFGLNIRGHGNSCDDVNPGFPGYILSGLEDKNKYIYRGAYMDCVRAVDFLFTLPQADKSKIVVEGASQGGALTFATAALNNDRIRLCVPMVPFLSDFPLYFKVASWPANEFVNYVETDKKGTWPEVYKTLSYFDIRNLAPWIKAPMLMCSGLKDEVCPSPINFAAFNNVPGEKDYIVYPEAGHSVPQDFYGRRMEWILKHLNQ